MDLWGRLLVSFEPRLGHKHRAPFLYPARAAQEDGLVTTATYKCDPATCQLPECQCATNKPPGGLSPDQIPQFVLVRERGPGGDWWAALYALRVSSRTSGARSSPAPTAACGGTQTLLPPCPSLSPLPRIRPQVSHDNALDGLPYKLVQGILGKKEQSNGCPVPVTW